MASVAWRAPRTGSWRFSHHDRILVAVAAAHALVLTMWPVAPIVAVGVWWNSNTIAHNFIHRPFFRSATANRTFSAALSVLLGIPQALWRERHLAHHAGVPWRLRLSRQLVIDTTLVVGLWFVMATLRPRWFVLAYAPGYLLGLVLCAIQGHWEHAIGQPTSHYGRIYNFLCFNDGYHAEHHADPSVHWTDLPRRVEPGAAVSMWPPLLRWLDVRPLEALEVLALHSPFLQRFVLRSHRRAIESLLTRLPPVRHVVIVGGGLFPRTALILRELLPEAHLTIVDSNPRHLATAQLLLGDGIEYRCEHYRGGGDADLIVIPLCFNGDRGAIYRNPCCAVLVHDWIWSRRGIGTAVSPLLLKRINLVRP